VQNHGGKNIGKYVYQCYEGIPFYVKTRDLGLGFCDLDPNSHFFVLLEPTQESNIGTSFFARSKLKIRVVKKHFKK
jgi:hypothetical protein